MCKTLSREPMTANEVELKLGATHKMALWMLVYLTLTRSNIWYEAQRRYACSGGKVMDDLL